MYAKTSNTINTNTSNNVYRLTFSKAWNIVAYILLLFFLDMTY